MIMELMTTAEVEQAIKDCQTVIVPYGVLEAHGTHLPLATDIIQACDAARRAAELVSVFVAPSVNYGMCRSAGCHPGTISIRGDTLRSLTGDVICSLYTMGMRNIILYSGHASTRQLLAMEEAGEKMLEQFSDLNVAVACEYEAVRNNDFIETPGDIHAGEMETSRMLFIAGPHVHRDQIPPAEKRTTPSPMLVRDCRRYWPGTVDGDPTKATRAKGEQLTRMAAEYLANLVRRMEEFDPH
jgi:creatinine amidohydrolase